MSASDLDRRVLGAGTTLRFALLVVLVITSCVELISLAAPRPVIEGVTNPARTCALLLGVDVGDYRLGPAAVELALKDPDNKYSACVERYSPTPWAWMAGGTALVLVLALLLYWWLPHWKTRSGRLVPVRDVGLAAELAELAGAAGLARPPRFVIDPVAATPSAVVFGRWRSHTVSLHAGLVARRTTDPDGFRTVVLHELAHIRNRDVDIAYATEALWRTFAVVVLMPFAVWTLYPGSLDSPGAVLEQWRTGWPLGLRALLKPVLLAALVLLARADVLRTRELYADLDAARFGGSPGSIRAASRAAGERRGTARRFAALWRTHPVWAEREESLLNPAALFGVRAVTMVLTGAAAANVVEMATLWSGPADVAWASELVAWLTAALITGIAGVALWRAVAHAVLTGGTVPSGLRAGVWLGLGIAVGELLTFRSAGPGWLPPAPQVLLLLVAATAGLVWWTTQCAEVWIRTCRGRSLHRVHLLGLAVMCAVFGAWFVWWYTRGVLFESIGMSAVRHAADSGFAAMTGTDAQRELLRSWWPGIAIGTDLLSVPVLGVGGLLLWLFPLAAWARRPVTGVPPWVRRAFPSGDPPGHVGGGLPSLRRVLAYGVAGGALCVCTEVAVRAWLHAHHLPAADRGDLWFVTATMGMVVALCAAAAVTAVVAYVRAPRHPLPVAFAAAGTALLLGLAGDLVLSGTDGCVPQVAVLGAWCGWKTGPAWFQIHTFTAPFTLGMGFYAVAFPPIAAVALRAWVTRRGARARRSTQDAQEPSAARRRVATAGARWAVAGAGVLLGVGAVLVVRCGLHAARPAHSTPRWLADAQSWTALALVLATATAAMTGYLAARRSGSGKTLRFAGLGAVAAGVPGALATFLLTATDGCVRPLGALAANCGWRPGLSWLWLHAAVAPAALVLSVALAAVVGLALALARVSGRSRPRRRPLPPAARWWARRGYVLAACVAGLVLLTGWWLAKPPQEAGLFTSALARQSAKASPSPSASPSAGAVAERRNRLLGWLGIHGQAVIGDLITDSRDLLAALRSTDGIQPGKVGPVCGRLAEHGRRAQAGTPPPESRALWDQALREAVDGGTRCREGVRKGDEAQAVTGLKELARSITDFKRFVGRLDDLGLAKTPKGSPSGSPSGSR
ncbi:M48 family metalloprotease [Streptomyces sp. NPDC020742]|uniref:M48 family metalloprotease n=1 Tax=Streptomyces sp. NPDC020742 TaxID=3154897 RepID=UPI0033D3C1CA